MTKKQTAIVQLISKEDLTKQLVSNVTEQMTASGIKLSPTTVMSVLRLAMEAVEGSPIKGADQKDLAVKVVLEIANSVGLPADQLAVITALVDGGFVSDTIDLVIAASQGKLNVNQVVEVAQGCFGACFRRKKKNPKQTKSLSQLPSPVPVPAPAVSSQPTPLPVPTVTTPEEVKPVLSNIVVVPEQLSNTSESKSE